MIFRLTVITALFWANTSIATIVGFNQGDSFEVFKASGTVTMTCGDRVATFFCEKEVTLPDDYAYFVSSIASADKVVLSTTDEEGEKVSRSLPFDHNSHISKKPVLVRGKTIFGNGFLPVGKSIIDYSLSYKGKVVKTGQFEAEVENTAARQCRELSLSSSREENCIYSINACDLYFYHSDSCLR